MANVYLFTDEMDLPGVVQWKKRGLITQPVEERESLAGSQQVPPFINSTVTQTGVNEETDICIRKTLNSPHTVEIGASASGVDDATPSTFSSEDEAVVDMQQTRKLQDFISVREPGLLDKDLSINVRKGRTSCSAADEFADLRIVECEEEPLPKKKGYITKGTDEDVLQLLSDGLRTHRGVINESQQVLYCREGMYEEDQHYKIIPGTQSKGAFGEAAMCQDLTTGKTFMRKTVKGKLSRNEIEVPVMFRGNVGIPEVYGVTISEQGTEIFQEFAGMSLKMLMERRPDYAKQLRDPKMVMVLGFQAFATLQKMHSQGVTHQDIKPENLCLDIQPKGGWRLKFIDFGSSQTPRDHVIEGLTNEYLSPESCQTILQIATGKLCKEAGRLGPGTDVWALSLSLLYCLLGYHVMVYILTGQPKYPEQDPTRLQQLRVQCLIKVCSLKDEDIMTKLIRPEWPEALKTLLLNTLRVDPTKRWSAKDAAEFILHSWILKGSGAHQQPAPVAAVPAPVAAVPAPQPVVNSIMFRGLTPARLVLQPEPVLQIGAPQVFEIGGSQAVQCTSPSGAGSSPSTSVNPPSSLEAPSPAQLPDFSGLLSNGTTKKSVRRSRGKQRTEPYPQPARRCSKNL